MITLAAQHNAHTLFYKVFTLLVNPDDGDDVYYNYSPQSKTMIEEDFVKWLQTKGKFGVLFGIFGLYLDDGGGGFLHAVAFTVRYDGKKISGIQWYDSMQRPGLDATGYPYAGFKHVWIHDAILVCEAGHRQTLITSEPTTRNSVAQNVRSFAEVVVSPGR